MPTPTGSHGLSAAQAALLIKIANAGADGLHVYISGEVRSLATLTARFYTMTHRTRPGRYIVTGAGHDLARRIAATPTPPRVPGVSREARRVAALPVRYILHRDAAGAMRVVPVRHIRSSERRDVFRPEDGAPDIEHNYHGRYTSRVTAYTDRIEATRRASAQARAAAATARQRVQSQERELERARAALETARAEEARLAAELEALAPTPADPAPADGAVANTAFFAEAF
jgi:hypothetical protein